MPVERFLEWLGNTPWSVALLESLYVWPVVESVHVLTLGLFVGTAVMHDLRLVGVVLKGIPIGEVRSRLMPWTRAGFGIMVASGLLIFYSSPLRYYHNLFFRFKVLLLLLAALNVWLFHRRIGPRIAAREDDGRPPRAARIAGLVSLLSWAAVVFAGRMIAYSWFDCDLQPQPAFVNWAAGCAVEP